MRYLKKFSQKSKKASKSAQKAFVLYDDYDHLSSQKLIEAVCNDLDFNLLKIDDLETKKVLKFQKVSEATQSQRISSVPDIIKEKLGTLEKILNNFPSKFINFFHTSSERDNDKDKEKDQNTSNLVYNTKEKEKAKNNFFNNLSNGHSNTRKDITKYFLQDTNERKIFNTINHNTLKFLNMKKTLILIIDSFHNIDEAKSYISLVMTKICDTKCPIVILTSNK